MSRRLVKIKLIGSLAWPPGWIEKLCIRGVIRHPAGGLRRIVPVIVSFHGLLSNTSPSCTW